MYIQSVQCLPYTVKIYLYWFAWTQSADLTSETNSFWYK